MTKIERIKLLLETEEQKIKRLSKEVTEDPPLTEARIRKGAYQNCLNILNQK